jgi:hypothetical protein
MRGTLHLLAPEDGGAFLSLMASTRTWELPSWQRYFGCRRRTGTMRATVREALAGPPLTREELMSAIVAHPDLAHLRDELRSGWGTLSGPLAWQETCATGRAGTRDIYPPGSRERGGGRVCPSRMRAAPVAIRAYLLGLWAGDRHEPPQLAVARPDRSANAPRLDR